MLARSEAAVGRGHMFDLAPLAADCITDLRARADDAAVEVRADLRSAWARGEPALLERMIANLIDNGIQHNERGGYLSIVTTSSGTSALLSVRNGGPAIDPAEAGSLTEPFRRLDRAFGGFGLGLSIVRSVAEAHGGSVEVVAPPSGGLEVRVALPLHVPAPDAVAAQPEQALTKS